MWLCFRNTGSGWWALEAAADGGRVVSPWLCYSFSEATKSVIFRSLKCISRVCPKAQSLEHLISWLGIFLKLKVRCWSLQRTPEKGFFSGTMAVSISFTVQLGLTDFRLFLYRLRKCIFHSFSSMSFHRHPPFLKMWKPLIIKFIWGVLLFQKMGQNMNFRESHLPI